MNAIKSTPNPRQQRGLIIAATSRITEENGQWTVPSQTNATKYSVKIGLDFSECTCPDHENHRCKCKHIFAVEYVIEREQHVGDQKTTVTETVRVAGPIDRPTYRQDWPAYNNAQTNEKRVFQSLLRDLCAGLDKDEPPRRGRPRLPLSDAVFAVTFKVYSTVSGRRFISDLEAAREKGYIGATPHFNSIFNYLENPAMTGILTDLIVRSSLPLASIESDFAVDSTGFSASPFERWYDHKWGKVKKSQEWVKCHMACGVKTNIVTAVEIHDKFMHDAPVLPSLVAATAKNFLMREVSADKAYSTRKVLETITAHGATPFVPFKSNARPAGGDLFSKLYHYFSLNQEEFLAHYHKRSNVESTMSMIKAKFRDHLRSKTKLAMRNEALCKVLCHNICCVISAIYELGITPDFKTLAA